MINRIGLTALAVAATLTASGCGHLRGGLCGGGLGLGCGAADCGCEVDCGCETGCAMEPDCGCELDPGCGCETGCGDTCGYHCGPGRDWALRRFRGDCNCEGIRFNYCVKDDCCGDASCGVEPDCGCEPACGCAEPDCGCEGSCGLRGCLRGWRFLGRYNPLGCLGCGGCDGELYWNEWSNDPPRCCDPCNRCGDWNGPGKSACCKFPKRVGSTTY